jgi:hypothetical protein
MVAHSLLRVTPPAMVAQVTTQTGSGGVFIVASEGLGVTHVTVFQVGADSARAYARNPQKMCHMCHMCHGGWFLRSTGLVFG